MALALTAPRLAFAQSSEPGLRTVEPNVQDAAPAQPAPRIEVAPRAPSSHVFDAYRIYADSATSLRVASAVGSLAIGASAVGAGIYANSNDDQEVGTALIVAGAVTAGIGAVSLVFPTAAERVAKANGVHGIAAPTREQEETLEREWARLAREAKTARHVAAGLGFVLSGAALATGAVYAASNGIDDDTKRWAVPTLLLSGGFFASGGFATLLMKSPAETSYAAFRAASPRAADATRRAPTLRLGASPLPKGGWIALSTNF